MSAELQRRPRKLAKGGTETSRKHRFQSFNQRIAKLSIDPIRRRRRGGAEKDDAQGSASFFETSLNRWKDLNLSEHFTNFVREVQPLCNSLPQVLHHNQTISNHLTAYIEKGDPVSLEPLLDLLSNFAHDLGVRFEEHFPRAVRLVASLAARSTSVEVVEWSFTCLAWLFKYLSRLLVPNLRPLFQIMTPLLGTTPQKVHITRFAAESMSFLVRKAALGHQKDPRPLMNFIDAVADDLLRCDNDPGPGANVDMYQFGLMSLFVNSIKGVERQLHSCGAHVYRSLIDRLLSGADKSTSQLQDVLQGVTIALVHHTDTAGLKPIVDIIMEYADKLNNESKFTSIAIVGRLLLLIATVRKGSRIQEWSHVLDATSKILALGNLSGDQPTAEIYQLVAVSLQSSPLELVLSKFGPIMDTVASEGNQSLFLPFCCYFSDLDHDRFKILLFPYFSRFVVSKWHENELQTCLSVSRILGKCGEKITCPKEWQAHLVRKLRTPGKQHDYVVECFSHLEALRSLDMASASDEDVLSALGENISDCLQNSSIDTWSTFTLGAGMEYFARCSTKTDHRGQLEEWWPLICEKVAMYGTVPPFLEATLSLVEYSNHKSNNIQLPINESDLLVDTLIENLHSASHLLRKLSLQILDQLYLRYEDETASVLSTALVIEDSQLNLQSARSISMHIRRLASDYEVASSHQWLRKAIPHFCFGLLTFKLSQVWEDAITALKEICTSKIGEEIVCSLALEWLEKQPQNLAVHRKSDFGPAPPKQALTEFQCSNLKHVEALINGTSAELTEAVDHLRQNFDAVHTFLTRDVVGAPTLALKVLSAVPLLAEKRSRYIVPKLILWATDDTDQLLTTEIEEETPKTGSPSMNIHTLKQNDRKGLIDLFGQFENPKVLYKSMDVLSAVMALLTNGDVEIQRSSLNALFTWKIPEIRAYEEHLLNLLDDARFRDEISTFLHTDVETPVIQDDHRAILMPVVMRLLYGKAISREGSRSGRNGQLGKRRAVLEAISRFEDNHLRDFVGIALGRLNCIDHGQNSDAVEMNPDRISARKQLGLVKMMKSLLEVLGSRLSPLAAGLTKALLYCLMWSERDLLTEDNEAGKGSEKSLLKGIRQTGMQCLNLQFIHFPPGVMLPFLPSIFTELLSPRMEDLSINTAQSISGTLQIFSTWASMRETVSFLVDYDSRTVKCIADCLGVLSAKHEVKLFVLETLKGIINHSSPSPTHSIDMQSSAPDETWKEKILNPNAESILVRVGTLLRRTPSKEILESAIQLVSMMAPLIESSSETKVLLDISAFLLNQAPQRVNPRSKGELLRILQNFIPMARSQMSADLLTRIFHTTSSLFGYFRDRENRLRLSQVLAVLAEEDLELRKIASLCASLNSFSAQKLDEPDFEERLKAFNTINEEDFGSFSTKQWRPLIYNMLYFVKDQEELAIRSNSSFALRRFVETNIVDLENLQSDSSTLVRTVLLPALRIGATESSELVRTEYLSIIAHLVRHNRGWQEINDMSTLLVDDDQEASFFANILHIQQHRRLRALRRLATEADKGQLRSGNVAHFLIPLIEHFIFDRADDEGAHNLGAETVTTIGALASSLEWPQFRAMLRRFSGYIQSKPGIVKPVIKLLSAIVNSLSDAAQEKDVPSDYLIDPNKAGLDGEKRRIRSTLMLTMPREEKFADDVSSHILPPLVKYLHEKDESNVSLRVSATVFVVKLLKLLPPTLFRERLPPVLTDLSNILRSRAQESRDLTRKTLVEIATLIGPTYFEFMLKELRGALARGYQLHVLSYTVHSMLVATSSIFKPGDIDHCLPMITTIIMDDIFGATGQEKDAEEYISKMREVKSSKSYDSMELVAKTATVSNIVHLIRPLQGLLDEKVDLRMVKKIDELLRRIGVGLLRNEAIQDQETLVFCHEIIRDVYKMDGPSGEKSGKEGYRTKRFLIKHKGAKKTGNRGSTSSHKYKLARFAMDTLRAVLHKYEGLQTPSNMHGFVPIIGDAIVQANEEIQTSGLRLLTTVIKVPLKAIDDNAPVYVAECVKIVKASTSTNVELAQAALKLVSAILRERRTIEIQEKDLAYLLKRLIPDLEEPDKQGIAFNFLKAIMMRKIVITEIYEVLDAVSVIMVTNQTKSARDLARGAYIQFIMDYPQSKDRFAKQLAFLVKNLEYKHQEGRQSVMEAIHLLVTKIGDNLVQEILGALFVPLVMVIVNDESNECREMAGALIKTYFARADVERTQLFLALLRAWLSQSDEPLLARVAYQVYGIFLDTNGAKAQKEIPLLQSALAQVLKGSLKDPSNADWELLYFGLQTFAKICQLFPASAFAADTAPLWVSIRQCLFYPHAWVKLSAAKILGFYFGDFAKTNANAPSTTLPLKGSGNLRLGSDEITEVTHASLNLLKAPNLSENIANQSVRNLAFLGKIMAQTSMPWLQNPLPTPEQVNDADETDSNPSEPDTTAFPPKSALTHLLTTTSSLLRRPPTTTRSPSLTPLLSTLALLTNLTRSLPFAPLTPSIRHILTPLHNLTDPTIPPPHSSDPAFVEGYRTLVTGSQEILTTLQEKMGTTEFVRVMQGVRERVRGRRDGRRRKRVLERVTEPERAGRVKRRKREGGRERRRERGEEERAWRRGW